MDIQQLQKHRVRLMDAWRESTGNYYGFSQAVNDGFMRKVASASALGYVPADLWLSHNLQTRYAQAEELEKRLLKGHEKVLGKRGTV